MRKIFIGVCSLFLIPLSGCPLSGTPTLPPATNGGGWVLNTEYSVNGILIYLAGNTTVTGDFVSDGPGTGYGDPAQWVKTSDAQGWIALFNTRAPATWTLTWNASLSYPQCDGFSTKLAVPYAAANTYLICKETSVSSELAPFTMNPSSLNPASPPESISITGSGFSSTYGMPVVQYFDLLGNLVNQQTVDSVSSDGTTLTASTPPFTELAAGTYAGIISNINYDGSYQYVGTVAMTITLPIYRPTQYIDAGGDPTQNPTSVYTGSNASLESYTIYNLQPGAIYVADVENGDCTWSGFPSHVDANNLTVYIPYTTSTNGYYGYFTMEVDVIIGGSNTVLFVGGIASSSGVLSATIPAGTDISTVQVHIDISTFDDGLGNPLDDSGATAAVDVYIQ